MSTMQIQKNNTTRPRRSTQVEMLFIIFSLREFCCTGEKSLVARLLVGQACRPYSLLRCHGIETSGYSPGYPMNFNFSSNSGQTILARRLNNFISLTGVDSGTSLILG